MLTSRKKFTFSSLLKHFSTTTTSSPTTSIRSNHQFNETNLINYLQHHQLYGFQQQSNYTIKQFTHGQSNPTFMIITSCGMKYTIRKQPPGDLLPGAHAVDREYHVMTALNKVI